jgi:mono/diheme cytochrome c family protein
MNRPGWPVRLGCAAAAVCVLAVAAGAQSLFDSGPVGFTEPQAVRGKAAYGESCASCHGPNLNDGQFAAPLKGAAFKTHWHDQSPNALW